MGRLSNSANPMMYPAGRVGDGPTRERTTIQQHRYTTPAVDISRNQAYKPAKSSAKTKTRDSVNSQKRRSSFFFVFQVNQSVQKNLLVTCLLQKCRRRLKNWEQQNNNTSTKLDRCDDYFLNLIFQDKKE